MRPGAGLKDRSHVGLLTRAVGRSPPGNSMLRRRCAYFAAQAIFAGALETVAAGTIEIGPFWNSTG